jgi:branched-chain amino acid transport system substrate-binding protein
MRPDKAMEARRGMKINRPHGPLTIDAQSRAPIQTVYIREVELIKGT